MERRTLNRRTLLESGITLQGALGLSPRLGATAAAQEIAQAGKGPLNASAEAKKIAYDTIGKGPKAFMISGFPSTRRSWNRLIPLLSQRYQCIPADLPSFGDSGILTSSSSRTWRRRFTLWPMTSARGAPTVGPCCFQVSSRRSR